MSGENHTVGEFIEWVNDCLGSHYRSVEELGDGVAYCKIIGMIYPGSITDTQIYAQHTKNDNRYIENFQMLENHFNEIGLHLKMDLKGLISKQVEPNVNFLQDFYSAFNARTKAVLCLQAAKKLKAIKRIESENAAKRLSQETKKTDDVKKLQDQSRKNEEQTKELSDIEEQKAIKVEEAMAKAMEAAERIKIVVEESLNQDLIETARITKAEIYGYEEQYRIKKEETADPYLQAIETAIRARDEAKNLIKDLAEHHAKRIKTSTTMKQKHQEAMDVYKQQVEVETSAKNDADRKHEEFENSKEVFKNAKFAVAVIDAYENANDKLQKQVQKDAISALKRAETGLQEFSDVKRSRSGLMFFSKIEAKY